jgi:predicted RNA-binding Zn ribbon-like protein
VASAAKENPDRRLELVREFVNTKDFDHDTDVLASPGELADWLLAKGLTGDGQRAGDHGAAGQGADGQGTGGHGAAGQGTSGHGADGQGTGGHGASGQGTGGHGADGHGASGHEAGGPASRGGLVVGPADLRRAIDFREALRALLLANNDGEAPGPAAVAVLNRIAERAKLVTHFDERGTAALEPVSGGVDGALGRLLAIVHDAMETGDWRRLKACRNDTCLWAFYDTSKNRSRHWCSMDSCGSQVKARTYRQRKKVGPPADTA